MIAADVAFHQELVRLMGSPRLDRAFETLAAETRMLLRHHPAYPWRTYVTDHEELLDGLRRRDPALPSLVAGHLRLTADLIGEELATSADAGAEPRRVNTEAFITCAVTGVGATTARSELVPITPEQIAGAGLEAARAGAAIVHLHVRDPETGGPSRDPALYREAVERIRGSGVDVVLNLTAGMGGDLVLGGVESPLPPNPAGTDMAGATERLEHVRELRPRSARSTAAR